uniref:NADH-plastoquinone oxidoreductase subunit I n=1 Tax=Selaginella uncinata TaxID=307165 RepID=A0A482A277_SELUN|nr:NADH-plastoquinone oxidoreductase subunit I [Selaginella uncinata]QBL07917.1 NADH-plastoquinone oxidoreductase subunit I [Selaginella uncinata]
MVNGLRSHSLRAIRAARYAGRGFTVTPDHMDRLPITIQYPYEKSIPSERFRGRIHFEFDKRIAREARVRVRPTHLPVVDRGLGEGMRRKRSRSHSIDPGARTFRGNRAEYRPTNRSPMTGEYEPPTHDRHELNHDQIASGRLPASVGRDHAIQAISSFDYLPEGAVASGDAIPLLDGFGGWEVTP